MSQARYCPQCGSSVPPGGRFCTNCGARVPELPVIPLPSTTSLGPSSELNPSQAVRWRLITVVVGLLVLLGIGGGAFFVLMYRSSEDTPLAQTTQAQTAQALAQTAQEQTAQALAQTAQEQTAQALAQTTQAQTAQALAQTTQARTAQALAQAAPTQTAVALEAEINALFASARRVFYDEFVDNRNAWFTGVFREIECDWIEDGVFKVLWTDRGTSYELYELGSFTDFISEVDCRMVRGGVYGSCGLIFAERRNVGFYKFEFFIDYYRLLVITTEDEPIVLDEGDPRHLTHVGDQNRLRVIRQGDRIRLFINGALVADLRDATFGAGRVGVSTACYREGGGVEVHFDNFGIWSLPTGS